MSSECDRLLRLLPISACAFTTAQLGDLIGASPSATMAVVAALHAAGHVRVRTVRGVTWVYAPWPYEDALHERPHAQRG